MEKNSLDFREILEHLPVIIFSVSSDGTITFVNRAFETALGYSQEEIIGKSVSILGDKSLFLNNFSSKNVYLKKKNKEKLAVFLKKRFLKNINQTLITAIELGETKSLKQVAEEYRSDIVKNSEILNNIIFNIPETLLIIDDRGNVVASNLPSETEGKISRDKDLIEKIKLQEIHQKDIKDMINIVKDTQRTYKSFNAFFISGKQKIPVHLVISPIIQNKESKGLVILIEDISQKKKSEEKLNLYKTIYENTLDAIGIVDYNGLYIDQNKSNEELLGYKIEELKNKPFYEMLNVPNIDRILRELKEKGKLRFISTFINRNGEKKYLDIVAISIKDEYGNDKYYVGIKRDITELIKREEELKKLNRQLKKRLYRDPLTGLLNRSRLIEDLKKIVSPKLAILNIDDFKEINDFYGYQTGDFVLKELAYRIKHLLPSEEFQIYRLSGDEFAILAKRYVPASKFEKLIGEIIHQIQEKPIKYRDNEIYISITAGISLENHNILNKADMALKYAKLTKKTIVSYTKELQIKELYENNIRTTRKIKNALKHNRLTVYYQPIFDNRTGQVKSYESLIRIIEPDGKILSPQYFLDVAKKVKLYPEITKKVIKTSFENFRNLPYTFSINLSVKDIENNEITDLIFRYLSDEAFKNRVIFEILESEGMENYDEVSAFLREVKNYGGKIALDDFGSGYSNFEYILKLDVDFLKIDASLIRNIHQDIYSHIIVETIVGFAKKLGIRTIAEFVHNEDVHEMVKSIGIDYSQGFYLGKPKPFEELFNG